MTRLVFRLRCSRLTGFSVTAAAASWLCILAASSFISGCAGVGRPRETGPELMSRVMAEALKASADAAIFAAIAERAVENADALKNVAERQFLEARTNGASARVGFAAEALKRAEKDAAGARETASRVAARASSAADEAAAVKKLAEQAAMAGQSQVEKLAKNAQRRSDRCGKEASAARKLSDELKKRWLSLSADPSFEPLLTNGVTTLSGPDNGRVEHR